MIGAAIGFRPVPLVYSQIIYNKYNVLRVAPDHGIEIVMRIIEHRRKNGTVNPAAGLFGWGRK
jgi:hypothetical protein